MSQNKVKWTPMQKAAIDARNKTLLVSAAAGSGKTAVLTERIISRLCDKENPGDISRMLIVTFTKAAANELKTRISRAISRAIADDVGNRHLSRQLLLLSSAKICTIHSFCLDVIKKNLKKLDFPNAMSVAGDAEIKLLAKEIMDGVINDAYADRLDTLSVSEFTLLADMLSSTSSDEAICEILLSLYDKKLSSFPEGIEFIKYCADELSRDSEKSFFESKHGKILLKRSVDFFNFLRNDYNNLLKELKCDETAYEKYIACFSDELAFIEAVTDELERGLTEGAANRASAFSVITLPSLPRGYDTPIKEKYKSLRNELRSYHRDELLPLLLSDEEEIKSASKMSARLLNVVYGLLEVFEKRFSDEKKRLGRLDFADIERYAYKLLLNNGEPSDIAKELALSFDEIYIDEYQDTNSIQDMIFSSIARCDNRFMVGDIKQSIYGFRGAVPENFSGYRDAFELYDPDKASNSDSNTIFLSNNFRCDANVVDFCNVVFSTLMKNTSGRVAYYDSDDLVCSKSDGEISNVPVKVVLAGVEDNTEDLMSESDYVASEIRRLISCEYKKDGSRISPCDIAVLVRHNSTSIPIEEALNALGIKTTNNVATEFFENSEILLVMALLNVIDNPLRDIYLAGVLKSPLFGFTIDELVKIRAFKSKCPLYDALTAYAELTGDEKANGFLSALARFRTLASGNQVDRLIRKLYSECSLFAVAAANAAPGTPPEAARENLMLLYKYARDFEASSFKGLSSFIKYVDDIIDQKTTLPGASSKSASDDNVQIMTIHHSKGLEFPVVFVVGAHKKVNTRDTSDPILTDRHAGMSIDLPGILSGTKIKTLHKLALEEAIKENSYEEEMRVLYVAYTRARERLYVSGSFKSAEEEYSKALLSSSNVCPHVIMKPLSFMRLTLIALLSRDYTDKSKCEIIFPTAVDAAHTEDNAQTEELDSSNAEAIINAIKENINFRYPFAGAVDIPAKLSVSALSSSVLDIFGDRNPDTESADELVERMNSTVPSFMLESKPERTAAERGTATHEFMQFCDFESIEKHGFDAELERMVTHGFILSENAILVSKDQVCAFFEGKLYNEVIKNACDTYREHRFNIELPALLFTSDPVKKEALQDEKLFIQGIIDCFVDNGDGTYTLIDYKTDHLPDQFKNDPTIFEKILAKRHCDQLKYYKAALEIITKKKVSRTFIYSFALNKEIDVTKMLI